MQGQILMVDDDKNVLRAFLRILRDAPYRILTAESAQQALEIFGRENIDVIVSDQYMRGMNGTHLLAHLREFYPGTVRILLTGQPQLQIAMDAINSGEIFRFLVKPCPSDALKKAIADAFHFRRTQSQGQALLKTLNETVQSLGPEIFEPLDNPQKPRVAAGPADRHNDAVLDFSIDE